MNLANIDSLTGDSNFLCPVQTLADFYASNNVRVYFYYFTQVDSKGMGFPKWMGCLHTFEISYVFGRPLIPANNQTQNEKHLSKTMLTYWTNFAKYQTPNNQDTEIEWPLYKLPLDDQDVEARKLLNLNADEKMVQSNLKTDRCALWNVLIPELKAKYI